MTLLVRNLSRSLLPILLLVNSTIAGPPPQLLSGKEWRQSPKTDAAHQAPYSEFTLAGKFLKWPQGDVTARPSLALDCTAEGQSRGAKGRFLQGYLLVGTPLKIDYVEPEVIHGTSYFPMVSVRYRLDNGKMRSEEWQPGTDRNSVSIPTNMLKNLLHAHTVLINVDENQAAEVSMQFDIPDSTQVGEACGVDVHKK
jgi:hypothetical protein